MAIYDTMQLITAPITVVVTGMAASIGSILLCGAEEAYPIPALSGFNSSAANFRSNGSCCRRYPHPSKEMEKLRDELNQIIANASGQPIEQIQKDTDRDFYMTAQETIEYGLADRICDSI